MFVSHETPAETQERLLRVIARAELRVYDGQFAFTEWPAAVFPSEAIHKALAFVRDEDVWSVLAPAEGSVPESLGVFAFHFTPGLDNSGFVGWLATHFKASLGTGVAVVCGQNTTRGGIFDYYGVPTALIDDVLAEVHRLREVGRALAA